METPGDNQIKTHETENRRLGYAQKFKAFIRDHAGILKIGLRLAQKAEDEYCPPDIRVGFGELTWNEQETRFDLIKFDEKEVSPPRPFASFMSGRGVILVPGQPVKDSDTGLEVTVLAKTKRDFRSFWGAGAVYRVDRSVYFKEKLGDQAFFIKKSAATNNPGYEEFGNSINVATTLNDIENLGIVEAQLGYADSRQSWFVSKWEDLENAGFFPLDAWIAHTPNDYGVFAQKVGQRIFDEDREITKKGEVIKEEIRRRLKDKEIEIIDLDFNLFYNPSTGKFFLLDITTRSQDKTIGQSPY